MSHAILSPSAASRWLACTPSARLEQQFPDRTSEAAEEGTVAHALAEASIRGKLGAGPVVIPAEVTGSKYYSDSMADYITDYVAFVMEQYTEAVAHTPDAKIYLETRLDLTDYVPEGFGTGDVVIIADGTMQIIDLKYGKGVQVSAERNKQMMLYALGAIREYDMLYDIQNVRMTIYQPRLDNFSTWEAAVDELQRWADTELKPKAKQAFAGEGGFAPGAHCRFCKARAVCKANADHQLQITQYEFKQPALLTDDEVADVLGRLDSLTSWASSVSEHALREAIAGKKWKGWKVVEGRSNRKYTNEEDVAKVLMEKGGFAEAVIYKRSLLGITEMEKMMGKKLFNSYLADHIIKPPGKPALAPETDKRPEYNAAVTDFADIEIED